MKRTQIYMLAAALSLLLLFVLPLWRITLEAPQYPGGINMYIWINQITGDTPSTLQNVNILNHYIGMKPIHPDSIPELAYFPYVIIGLVVLGIAVAFVPKRGLWLSWAALIVVLGALGIYDFYLWEYDYGHNLDPNAPIKVAGMAYQPPLIGSKMLLNFKADSYPHWGAIALVLAIGLSVLAWWQEGKSSGAASKAPNWKQAYSLTAWWLLLLVGASGCSPQPRPIQYGKDACAFCQMTIVDQRYGTELVSKTGKVYTFDSIECLVQYLQQGKLPKEEVYQSLLTDFNQPGQLIEAGGSYVLFSPDLPSPMGMYLTAFADPAEARTFLEEHPGKLFDWQALQRQFDSLAQEVRSSKIN